MADQRRTEIQRYKSTCGTCTYTLPMKYQKLTTIGVGAYGAVICAKDTEINQYVAIKKVLRPFETKVHAKRTYRELKLLQYLNNPNSQIVQLYDVFTPAKTLENFDSLYFVFKYAGSSLDKAVKCRPPLSNDNISRIIYLILRGLKYAHSAGIIHRDLKPANIAIDNDLNITILDFGLSRVASDGIQTGYVATRWWRAPEVFINWENYDEKLDTWSVGCIMAELIRREPIFCGSDHIDQLIKIFNIIGTPDLKTLHEICTPEPLAYLSQLNPKPPKDFNQLFGYKYDESGGIISGVSREGVNLLRQLLSFDPRVRPTVEQALASPYMRRHHNLADEPIIEPLVDNFQDADFPISRWRDMVWEMIQKFESPSWISKGSNSGE